MTLPTLQLSGVLLAVTYLFYPEEALNFEERWSHCCLLSGLSPEAS